MTSEMSLRRRRLFLLLVSQLLPLSRATADPLPRPSEAVIDRLMQMLARVQESQATFTEVKIMAGLTRPLQGTGRLFYRRPSHLEKVTLEPQPERLVVDGNRLTLAEGNAPPQIIDLNGEPVIRTLVDAMRGTLSGDLASLQRSYRVSIEGEIAAWRLTLVPLDPSVAQFIVSTTIEGAGTSLQTVQTALTSGDVNRMTITPVS